MGVIKYIVTTVLFLLLFFVELPRLNAQSVGGTTSGAATYCSTTNSGFLSLTGYTGSILNWESSIDGGTTWTNIGNITPAQSYVNLSQTTCYRAIVQSGAFSPDTSTVSCITIFQPSDGGTITGGGTFCSNSGTGTITLTGNTGNVLNWQFSTDGGASWTTVSDTTNLLNYPAITANTLYAAVVQNGSCPVDTSSFAVFNIIPPSVGGMASADDTVCYLANAGVLTLSGNTGTITGWIASTDGGLTWASIPGSGTTEPYSGLSQTTLFAAIVQNSTCPADTSSGAIITVLSLPSVFAGNDTTILSGQTLTLQGSGTGNPVWTPSTDLDSNNIFTPIASPMQSVNYMLTVTDTNGCVNSDVVMITVTTPVFAGIITTLFTPNGDGINDTWYIQNIQNYPGNEVSIFNIYGQQVFSKSEYMNDWKGTYNGEELPDGTYYYVLKFSKEDIIYKGSLDILRNK